MSKLNSIEFENLYSRFQQKEATIHELRNWLRDNGFFQFVVCQSINDRYPKGIAACERPTPTIGELTFACP